MRAIEDPRVELYAADMDRFAAGLYLVPSRNRWLLPAGDAPEFVDDLLALCSRLHIDVVVPTVDSELLPIARRVDCFKRIGTRVLSESETTLACCLDKYLLFRFARGHLPVPRTEIVDPRFLPVFFGDEFVVKPRNGSGGRGFRVHSNRFGLGYSSSGLFGHRASRAARCRVFGRRCVRRTHLHSGSSGAFEGRLRCCSGELHCLRQRAYGPGLQSRKARQNS